MSSKREAAIARCVARAEEDYQRAIAEDQQRIREITPATQEPPCPILLGEVRNLTEHWGDTAVRAAMAEVLGEAEQ